MNNDYRQPWFTKAINYAISSEQPLKTSIGELVYVTKVTEPGDEDFYIYTVRIANDSEIKESVCFDFLLETKKWLWDRFKWNENDII